MQGRYEGFGPNGSMIIAETLTSNVNRTIANVRTIFNKKGGNIGAAGSVSYMFDNTGRLYLKDQTLTIFLKFYLKLKLMFVM